ncbi:MAG: hypothetical protein JSW10_13465 [Pseudomonadota bacterium]|nr:MAG: hypothetical protein JSW10_13465 [Pseudomonadota bacterium]
MKYLTATPLVIGEIITGPCTCQADRQSKTHQIALKFNTLATGHIETLTTKM